LTQPAFLLATAAAVLLALAFVVVPLVGSRHRSLLAALIVLLPASTLALYALIGTPGGVDPDTGQTGEIRTAVTDLARRAMGEPDNAEHWARLGLAYKSLEEFASAEHAFRRALYIEDSAPFLKAELGETLLYASGERQLPPEARRLLEEAADAQNQKALWLLGLDAFQQERFDQAEDRFEALLTILPPQSEIRGTVDRYLAAARAEESALPRNAAPDDTPGPRLDVRVSITDALAEGLDGSETVFLAVRRSGGGPPLAVRRLRADELPAQVNISDADAMIRGSGLSSAESIVVVARVAFSGQATPAEGDLEGRSGILWVGPDMNVEVQIDQVL
jgi:cytochrome c-type biogenesis protein CcmH